MILKMDRKSVGRSSVTEQSCIYRPSLDRQHLKTEALGWQKSVEVLEASTVLRSQTVGLAIHGVSEDTDTKLSLANYPSATPMIAPWTYVLFSRSPIIRRTVGHILLNCQQMSNTKCEILPIET